MSGQGTSHVRIATPSKDEREIVNTLTPQERLDALLEAASRKQRYMREFSFSLHDNEPMAGSSVESDIERTRR